MWVAAPYTDRLPIHGGQRGREKLRQERHVYSHVRRRVRQAP